MSIRDSLLRVFDGAEGHKVSGEKLANQLGVSRTAIWKQIKALQAAGLPLESTGRHGYRFKAPLDGSLIAFRGPGWVTPHYQLSTSSTQSLAKAGAAAGLSEGHLWVAEVQTKGRGRLDRSWESNYGGLWFSLLLRPKMSPARVASLTLVAGLALREAVEKVCAVKAKLKWPNDLLVDQKKIAGILTEMSGQTDRTDWLVIGVGINVNNPLTPQLNGFAKSLRTLTGQTLPRAALLQAFLTSFHTRYALFCEKGFDSFREEYWTHYFAPRQPTVLKTAEGSRIGKAVGVDASGAIMIESRRKIQAYTEGEIVL